MAIVTAAANVSSFRSLMDGTMRITVDLQELPAEKTAEVLSILNKFGYFTFSFNREFSDDELLFLSKLDESLSGDKSQSKRLRNVLFLIHKNINNGNERDFETFYQAETEKIIQHYKSKLPKDNQ